MFVLRHAACWLHWIGQACFLLSSIVFSGGVLAETYKTSKNISHLTSFEINNTRCHSLTMFPPGSIKASQFFFTAGAAVEKRTILIHFEYNGAKIKDLPKKSTKYTKIKTCHKPCLNMSNQIRRYYQEPWRIRTNLYIPL